MQEEHRIHQTKPCVKQSMLQWMSAFNLKFYSLVIVCSHKRQDLAAEPSLSPHPSPPPPHPSPPPAHPVQDISK